MAVNKKIPQRQCVVCGEFKDKKSMIRVIKTNEDEIFLDDTGKKNGRGAYICKTAGCLAKAIKNKGIDRSLKMKIPENVYDELIKEMNNIESR